MKSSPTTLSILWLLAATLALCLWTPPEIHPGSRLALSGVAALLSCLLAVSAFKKTDSPGLPPQARQAWGGLLGVRPTVGVILTVGGLCASSALSLNPYRSIHLLAALAGACAFYLACRRWAPQTPRLWIAAFLTIASVVALAACLQAAGGLEQTLRAALEADPELPAAWRARLESGRVFGTLLLPATLGGLMGMAAPVAVGLAFDKRGSSRIAACLAAVLLVEALVLSRSYGALLTTAAACVWAAGRLSARRAAAVRIGVLSLALLAALAFSVARFQSAGQRLLEPQGPIVQRWLNWKTALEIIGDAPVLGCGPGAYASAFVSLRQEGENDTRYVHNTPLQAAAEAGVWVLLPLGFGLVRLYPRLQRALRGTPAEAGVATGVVAFLLHNLLDFTAYLPSTLWAALALVALLPGTGRSGTSSLTRGSRTWVLVGLAIACVASLGPVARQWRGGLLRERAREVAVPPDGREAADLLYAAAVRADPDRAELRLEYAGFLLTPPNADPARALPQAQAAARGDRGSALAHGLMSMAWAAEQEWAEAVASAEAAAAIHPRSERARAWRERLREHLDAASP